MVKRVLPVLLALSLFTSCNPRPKLLWTFQTGAPIYGSPAIAKDRIIVGSNDHCLYALDLSSGKQIWKTDLGDRVLSTAVVDSEYAYVGSASGRFFAVHLRNGKIEWSFKADDSIDFDTCADQDSVYFGSQGRFFYRLSKSGQKIWDYPAGFYFTSNCEFYKNLVITSSWDTNFYAFDRASGAAVWKLSSGLFNYGGPVINGDTVYFGTHTSLYRLEAGSGKVRSIEKVSYLDWPEIYDGFLWTNDGGLKKRSLDGKIIGSVDFQSGNTFKPVGFGGYVIQSTTKQYLYAISKEMKILWKFKGQDDFWSSGTVHNNVYYTGNRDGRVYALRLPQ